jgi:uncharacterized membrane protein
MNNFVNLISPLSAPIFNKNIENYSTDKNNKPKPKPDIKKTIKLVFFYLINFIIGIWAVSISWKVNTVGHWSIIFKILFAIIAFLFAPVYILLHFIFRYENLSNYDVLEQQTNDLLYKIQNTKF